MNDLCKKNNQTMFDVTMDSFDVSEVCELVGLFILDKLEISFKNNNFGPCRDDGLPIFKNMGTRAAGNTRKKFHRIFNEIGLKVD